MCKQWQASGGLGNWRAKLKLCAALSDLQSQFDWFKAPSSCSSPNSLHGALLSGLMEGLSENAQGWQECDIWIASCSKYIHGQRLATNSPRNLDSKRLCLKSLPIQKKKRSCSDPVIKSFIYFEGFHAIKILHPGNLRWKMV